MILTCPGCAARYVVGEDQVGPQGRKVKCSACGEVWRAVEDSDFEIPADPYLVTPPEPEPEQAQAEAPVSQPAPPPQDELRQRMRARVRRQSEQGRTMLWATLTTLVVVTAVVVVFRQEIAVAVEAALQ